MSASAVLGGAADLAAFTDVLPQGIVTLDAAQRVALWNRWMVDHSGIAASEAIGRTLPELFPEMVSSRLLEAIGYAIQRRMPALLSPTLNRTLLRLYKSPEDRRQDRRMKHLIHVVQLRDQPHAGVCLLQINDVTAAVNRERLLRQQAESLRMATQYDATTGVLNRRYFDSVIALEFNKACQAQTPLAMMQIDVDDFASYASLYGAEEADRCLADIAGALKDSIPGGGIVGRYGEEKFAIALAGFNEQTVCDFAENFRLRVASLAIPHENSKIGRSVTVSIGVAIMHGPNVEIDLNALISSSDIALFHARNEGHNKAILFSMADGCFHNCA